MVDFVIGRPQPESPGDTMLQQDLETPSTLGQAFGSGIMETTEALLRGLRESQYETGIFGAMGRAISAGGLGEVGQSPELIASAMQPQPDPVMRAAAEINQAAGAHITDQPMGSHLADLLIDAKKQEIERENIWSRFANAHSWPTNLAVGSASFLIDPLNAATLFVPGIGEEALLARFGAGLAGRMAAGAGSMALGTAAAQAPLTALKYGVGREEGSDYSLRAAFGDLAINAVSGAVAGAAFGGMGPLLRSRGIEVPEVAARAGELNLAAEVSRVLDVPATTRHAAFDGAVAQLAEGRAVDVEPFMPPRRPQDLIDVLMNAGGVRDDGGELRAIDLNRPQRGKFGILSREKGMSLDDARELAEEEGFLSRGSDVNDLLNAIRETAQGLPRFRPEEAVDWRRYETARRRGEFEPGGVFDPNEFFGEISPADVVDRERQLYREGFAAGIPQAEMEAANAALAEHVARPEQIGEAETEPPEGWAAVGRESGSPQTASEPEKAAPGTPAGAGKALEADPELADAERRFAEMASTQPMLPEEQAVLDESRAAVERALMIEQAFQTAAACLKDAGI